MLVNRKQVDECLAKLIEDATAKLVDATTATSLKTLLKLDPDHQRMRGVITGLVQARGVLAELPAADPFADTQN